MAPAQQNGHAAHDSALSVGSSAGEEGKEHVGKIRELESEVKFLVEKAAAACMSSCTLLLFHLHAVMGETIWAVTDLLFSPALRRLRD